MIKVIYIGTTIPDNRLMDYPETSIAANNFQAGLLRGILKNSEIDISVFSVPPRKSWPGKGAVLKQSKEQLTWLGRTTINIIPFLNIKYWKELSIRLHTYFSLRKALQKTIDTEQTVVISYNGDGRIADSIRALKRRYRFVYLCMVVDPPEYKGTTTRSGSLWEYIYARNRVAYMKAVQCAEALVVLNKAFIDINSITKPYLVIDGGISLKDIDEIHRKDPLLSFDKAYFNIVFTGTLHEHSGILRLINMFSDYKNNKVRLHIFGEGLLRAQVENKTKEDCRIIYHGGVSFEKAISAQYQADLIVCPNPINHPINRVAFPSKLIEYLGSCTPILVTSLDSIGNEYKGCVIFYDDTTEDFIDKLTQIMQLSIEERTLIGRKAYEMARKQKDWEKQSELLFCFLKELL